MAACSFLTRLSEMVMGARGQWDLHFDGLRRHDEIYDKSKLLGE